MAYNELLMVATMKLWYYGVQNFNFVLFTIVLCLVFIEFGFVQDHYMLQFGFVPNHYVFCKSSNAFAHIHCLFNSCLFYVDFNWTFFHFYCYWLWCIRPWQYFLCYPQLFYFVGILCSFVHFLMFEVFLNV
jgi:hypothetical protein